MLLKHLSSSQVAERGRNGDSLLGHLTPGDVVVPRESMTPGLMMALRGNLGSRLPRFVAGSPQNRINPRTGLREFMDGSGQGGSSGGGNTGDPGGNGRNGPSGNSSDAGPSPNSSSSDVGPTGRAGDVGPSPNSSGSDVGPSGRAGDVGSSPNSQGSDVGPSGRTGDVGPAPNAAGNTSGLSSEDLLAFDTSKSLPGFDISRTSEKFGPGLGEALANFFGYNMRPSLKSQDIPGLFSASQPPGFNSNIVGTALGALATVAGIPGPVGLLSDSLGVSKAIGQGLFGLQAPDPSKSLGAFASGHSIRGDPTTGDLSASEVAAASAAADAAAAGRGNSGPGQGNAEGDNRSLAQRMLDNASRANQPPTPPTVTPTGTPPAPIPFHLLPYRFYGLPGFNPYAGMTGTQAPTTPAPTTGIPYSFYGLPGFNPYGTA